MRTLRASLTETGINYITTKVAKANFWSYVLVINAKMRITLLSIKAKMVKINQTTFLPISWHCRLFMSVFKSRLLISYSLQMISADNYAACDTAQKEVSAHMSL